MIPFHKLYALLFKSFSIGEETKIVERLIEQGYTKMMIIKRSWVYILKIIWIPLLLILLSGGSIWIALYSISPKHEELKWTIIIGNSLMTGILLISSFVYWKFFRDVYKNTDTIIHDLEGFKSKLQSGDRHFITFFNWSITNQVLLFLIMILEILFIFNSFAEFRDNHFLILILDFVIIVTELYLLQKYRKHMIDLEMDYNIVVQGKMFFINQSGILSNTQTLESDKIKTIKSTFPHPLASFFNFGTIEILAEGDMSNLGEMNMHYVTSPAKVVNSIQTLLGERRSMTPNQKKALEKQQTAQEQKIIENAMGQAMENTIETKVEATVVPGQSESKLHARDTRGKIRDIIQ